MKKIMNKNMAGQTMRYRSGGEMKDATCDDNGCVELPEDFAQKLLQTPGWSEPVVRAPRKAPRRPVEPPKPQEVSEDASDEEEAEEGAEGEAEGEEVPPYEEWDYPDLKAEAKKRQENDPTFQPPDSAKKEDIIKALELDDAKD